jgi:hypothetical protein
MLNYPHHKNPSSPLIPNQAIYRPLAMALAMVLGTTVKASTFTVSNTGSTGNGSLQQAVIDANASAGVDNIVFDSKLTGSTIFVSSEMEVTEELTITGPGDASSIIINGNGATGLFNVTKHSVSGSKQLAPLTLENITLTGGSFRLGSAITSISPLTLNNTVVTGNTGNNEAISISGIDFTQRIQLTLNQSIVSGNSGTGVGAGFAIVELNQSTVSDNDGRGISSGFSQVRLNQSTVSGNTGVGVSALLGEIILEQSTVSGNQGGGIVTSDTTPISLKQSTITNNTNNSRGAGGGLDVSSSYASVYLENTILANNTGPGGNFSFPRNFYGNASLNARFSLFGDDVSEIHGTNTMNVFTNSPSLGGLQNNGGLTLTHLPNIDSPALDAGNITDDPANFDQRGSGFPRTVNGIVDIGAVERQATKPPQITHSIPVFSLPGLLVLITSLASLAGWRRRSVSRLDP